MALKYNLIDKTIRSEYNEKKSFGRMSARYDFGSLNSMISYGNDPNTEKNILEIRFIELVENTSIQGIFESADETSFLLLIDQKFTDFFWGFTWNVSTNHLATKLSYINRNLIFSIDMTYHDILGLSKALSIAFLY